MIHENIILSEEASHEIPHIPFIQNIQSRHIYTDRKYIIGCLGLGSRVGQGVIPNGFSEGR